MFYELVVHEINNHVYGKVFVLHRSQTKIQQTKKSSQLARRFQCTAEVMQAAYKDMLVKYNCTRQFKQTTVTSRMIHTRTLC